MFSLATMTNDGTNCSQVGNGNPNTNGVTLLGTCTNGIYFDCEQGRGTNTVYTWEAANNAWVAIS